MSEKSYKSYKSRSSTSTRCGTPKPAEPTTDCERRRQAIERLERQDILITGYKKFMLQERTINREQTPAYYSLEGAFRETLEAKDKLVSELRTIPPCLDVNCPDHTTLKPKDNDNHNDSDNDIEMREIFHVMLMIKNLPLRGKIAKVARMALSFLVKQPDRSLQLQCLTQSK
ncbi:uncharacterized protein TNIN_102951 [Trichonephila inaurata madagascariensis]|uniref:Uncharacterized protein n=1 Tax=Trichonephila inaurata madagascariensis TaxID=2747483 RepID=A0A8X6XTJ1_9ARAC|nr:uncharacterized protein TNIN_102951 [Trichonephila inaurata madagascariensis]